jgi:hypothetical protein
VYFILTQQSGEQDVNAITRQIWQIMVNQGRRLIKEGKTLESDEETLAELGPQVKDTLTLKVPVWRQLGMM